MLPAVEVANLVPVPKGQTSLQFNVLPNVDLLPYVNAGSEISSSAKGKSPPMDVTFDGTLVVTVKL